MCETFFSSTIYESNPERIICIENKSDMTILFKVTNGYTLKTPRKTDKTLEIISFKKNSDEIEMETSVNKYTLYNEYGFFSFIYYNENEIKVAIQVSHR